MRQLTLCYPIVAKEILLGFKKTKLGAGLWNGAGGEVEEGEGIRDANYREVDEEFRIRVVAVEYRGYLTLLHPERPALSSQCHLFVARRIIGTPQETREMRPQWFPLDGIPYHEMWKTDILWLPNLINGETIHRTFSYDANLQLIPEAT